MLKFFKRQTFNNNEVKNHNTQINSSQIHGAVVRQILQEKQQIISGRNNIADNAFKNAIQELNKADTLINNPSGILGSAKTKHGEMAEIVEIGVRNARRVINNQNKSHSTKGVGRTAGIDFKIFGRPTQQKFYKSLNKTLGAGVKHVNKYLGEKRDLVIPKDQFEILKQIKRGIQPKGMQLSEYNAIIKKISLLEKQSVKIKESVCTYDESKDPSKLISREKQEIEKEHNRKKSGIQELAKPTLNEGLKVTGQAAIIEGSMQALLAIYNKKKPLRDFSAEDWSDVGGIFAKGTVSGGVKGAGIYGLSHLLSKTNPNSAAPLAAAYVSATIGVAKLYNSYVSGDITKRQFVDQGQLVCFDTSINYLGATAGQVLIPIPYLGAIIGSISSNILGSILKNVINKREQELIQLARVEHEECKRLLDKELYELADKLQKRMNFLWGLSRDAFNVKLNSSLRFQASIKLAEAQGVADNKILKSNNEIDNYFM